MSSGSRRGASEENILAMLERDAARRRLAGNPRFAMYAIAGSVALSLVGALAWLLHENNNANEMLRLPDQPGVSVTVVPDKPAGPALAVAEPGMQSAAATIVDTPEPAVHKVADTQPVNKIAQAEPPASKAALPSQPATKAQEDLPPLVLLKPEEAKSAAAGAAAKKATSTAARTEAAKPAAGIAASTEAAKPAASAPARTESVRQAASTPAHADTARRSASAAAHEPAATRGTAPARVAAATKKSGPARDEARRIAARQHAAEADQPARSSRAGTQAKPAAHGRAEALAGASAHPRATSQTRTKKVSAPPEKKAEGAVDTDVALISAIIMHADGRADKKAAAKP
jgi:hypothetical protein